MYDFYDRADEDMHDSNSLEGVNLVRLTRERFPAPCPAAYGPGVADSCPESPLGSPPAELAGTTYLTSPNSRALSAPVDIPMAASSEGLLMVSTHTACRAFSHFNQIIMLHSEHIIAHTLVVKGPWECWLQVRAVFHWASPARHQCGHAPPLQVSPSSGSNETSERAEHRTRRVTVGDAPLGLRTSAGRVDSAELLLGSQPAPSSAALFKLGSGEQGPRVGTNMLQRHTEFTRWID